MALGKIRNLGWGEEVIIAIEEEVVNMEMDRVVVVIMVVVYIINPILPGKGLK